MNHYQALVQLLLVSRPENILRLGPRGAIEEIFATSAEGLALIVREPHLLYEHFNKDAADAIKAALQIDEITAGTAHLTPVDELPLKIQHALDTLEEYGFVDPQPASGQTGEA